VNCDDFKETLQIINMTMKNFVGNLLNFVKNTFKNLEKSPMLKWANKGGGGSL
jgi:hypothetical protein